MQLAPGSTLKIEAIGQRVRKGIFPAALAGKSGFLRALELAQPCLSVGGPLITLAELVPCFRTWISSTASAAVRA